MTLKADRIGTERTMQPMGAIARFRVLGDDPDTRWHLNPPFQRGAVWTAEQKQAWIESILMGLALPAIIVNRFPEKHPVYGWGEIVIDGQQRLRATAEFMQNKFSVRGERWADQPIEFQRGFTMADGLAPVIYCKYSTEVECAKLYLKLLLAGTSHTPAEIKQAREFIRRQV